MGFDIQKIISDIVGNVSGGVSSASETIANFAKTDQGKIIIGGIAGRIAGTSAGIDPNTAAISGAAGVSERITKRRDQDKVIKANQDAATKRNEFQAKQQTERLVSNEKTTKLRIDAQIQTAQERLEATVKAAKTKEQRKAITTVNKRLINDEKYQRNDWHEEDRVLYEKALQAKEMGFDIQKPKTDNGRFLGRVNLKNKKIIQEQLRAINFIK